MMGVLKNALALVGALFVGAGVGMMAGHYGVSEWLSHKLFGTVFVLLVVWAL